MKPAVSQRDKRLDALRGLFLVIMTIDHLPSILRRFTSETLGYVSAAEGFVLLSGFVSGLLYARSSPEQSHTRMWPRACRRARTIYSYHILLFIAVFITLHMAGVDEFYSNTWRPLLECKPIKAIILGSTLLYQPRFLDILPMYCVFVLLTPFIIRQLQRGKRVYVLGASLVLWILAQLGLRKWIVSLFPSHMPVDLGDFDIFAWQCLYVVGLYFGSMSSIYNKEHPPYYRLCSCFLLFVVFIFFFFSHHCFMEGTFGDEANWATNKSTLGVARFFNSFCVFLLTASQLPGIKSFLIIDCLAFLGRHSLQVYTFHVFIVYLVDILLSAHNDIYQWQQSAIVILVVLSLYFPAWISERVRLSAQIRSTG